MSAHLSHRILAGYTDRTLSSSELLDADDHIANCDACRSLAVAMATGGQLNGFAGLPEDRGSSPHLDFAQMATYVDCQADAVDVEITEVHLRDCIQCSDEIDELRQIRDETFHPTVANASMPPAHSMGNGIRGVLRSWTFRLAMPAIFLAGLALVIYFVIRSPVDFDETQIAVVQDPNDNSPVGMPQTEEPALVETNMAAVTLVDGSGEIRLDAAGKVMGKFAAEYDPRIETALRTGDLPIAAEATRLRSQSGVLMGQQQGDRPGLRVLSPAGKVITANRPDFRWTEIEGADSYTVEVFDTGFNKVAESPPLEGTRWQIDSPLPRGREYSWQVTAIKNGETIRAPSRPSPDAKFVVVSGEKLREIARAKAAYGRSNLVLGLVYAEAGLIDESEREFRSLVNKNPRSKEARALLQRIRAVR